MQTYIHVFPAGLVAGIGHHTVIFVTDGERAEMSADARRIAACLSACEGMSTEQLEELDNGQLADIGHYWLRDS